MKPSFSSPSPPARTDRLSQPARVIFNHMIARGLLSLQQFNWELWPAYSGVAGGHVSGSTPAAAGGGCWSPGCSRHPEPGCLHQADAGCGRGIQAPPLRESSAPTRSPRAGGSRPDKSQLKTALMGSKGEWKRFIRVVVVCLRLHTLQPASSSVHGISQARILEVCCHSLLQGIFPIQGLNPCLLHWQVNPLPLSH